MAPEQTHLADRLDQSQLPQRLTKEVLRVQDEIFNQAAEYRKDFNQAQGRGFLKVLSDRVLRLPALGIGSILGGAAAAVFGAALMAVGGSMGVLSSPFSKKLTNLFKDTAVAGANLLLHGASSVVFGTMCVAQAPLSGVYYSAKGAALKALSLSGYRSGSVGFDHPEDVSSVGQQYQVAVDGDRQGQQSLTAEVSSSDSPSSTASPSSGSPASAANVVQGMEY